MHLLNLGTDEAYYISVIRGLARGASIYQAATQAPLPQVWLLKMGFSLQGVLFAGDVIYPLLTTTFLFLAALALLRSSKLAAATALIAAMSLGNYWLRSSNPQVPYLILAAYAAVFCSSDDHHPWSFITRGVLIGLLCYVQLLFASLLLLVEGVDLIRRIFISRLLPAMLWRSILSFVCVFLILFLPLLLGLITGSDTVSADVHRRLGVIPSHYPAAPLFQVQLIIIGLIFVAARMRPYTEKKTIDIFLTFIVASLIGFNQAVIHGIDATFSSYYVNVLLLLQWGALPVLLIAFFGRTKLTSAILIVALLCSFWSFHGVLKTEEAEDFTRVIQYQMSDEGLMIDRLLRDAKHETIAAPLALANLIPVMTDNDVLFSTYAYNWHVSDQELAERYQLQRALFPSADDAVQKEQGYPSVFGGYAGMLAARERTACRMWSRLLGPDSCAIDARSLVYHEDLRTMLDGGRVDVDSLMRKFKVSEVISDDALPSGVHCSRVMKIGKYVQYACT